MINLEILRIALAKKNLSQIAAARFLGVDHGTFSRWKRWYPVPEKYRSKLAHLLDVRENELFEGSKDTTLSRSQS